MLSSYDGTQTVSIATVLQNFANFRSTGCLSCSWQKVQWLVYFNQGNVIYVTHSIKPEERFERHLRLVRQKDSPLSSANRSQLLGVLSQNIRQKQYNPEYKTLDFLLENSFLNLQQVMAFILRSSEECLESLLLADKVHYKFQENDSINSVFTRFEPSNLIAKVEVKLKNWQALTPEIVSPYQCPYLPPEAEINTPLAKEIRQKFGKILMGFNFRELSARLYQDELMLAKKLYPLIQRGLVRVREPQHPFNQLPKFSFQGTQITSEPDKTIICVDDSPSVLRVIKNYLNDPRIAIHLITESPKALMEIIHRKPDLILLDVSMPNLDGYQLCKFIRNHSELSQIPIIMVTGKTGWIDRAKAKVSGATDYLVKPFSQDELVQMVSKYVF